MFLLLSAGYVLLRYRGVGQHHNLEGLLRDDADQAVLSAAPADREEVSLLRERLLQGTEEVPAGVGAVAGAHQRHRDFVVGEQGVAVFTFSLGRAGAALLQGVRRRQQVAEQRVQRQEIGQVAFVRGARVGFGHELPGLAAQRAVFGHGQAQLLRGHFCAHWRPVGVGAQEHLATVLGLLQRVQQVRREDTGLAGLGVELLIQATVQ
ncbi:hypothetical protein D9M73_167920 [compost metagenome]